MGNNNSKSGKEIVYNSKIYPSEIQYKINDDFPYPRQPKLNDINAQFEEILKNLSLKEELKVELPNLSSSTKWKLICKHRYFLLTNKPKPDQKKSKSKAEKMIESLKSSDSITNYENLYFWLSKEANEPEIVEFISLSGVKLIIEKLKEAELTSRATKNTTKQICLLKILSFLTDYTQAVNYLITLPNAGNDIFENFKMDGGNNNNAQNYENVSFRSELKSSGKQNENAQNNGNEMNRYVLEIMNSLLWNSENGNKLTFQALENYAKANGNNNKFEVFIESLKKTGDIGVVEMMVPFINSLVESIADENKRRVIRSELVSCGLKDAFKVFLCFRLLILIFFFGNRKLSIGFSGRD